MINAILLDEPGPADREALRTTARSLAAHGVHALYRISAQRGSTPKGVIDVIRPQHRGPDDLLSLFSMGPRLMGEIIVIQGRVAVSQQIIGALLATPSPGAMTVDRRWRDSDTPPAPGALYTEEEHGYINRLSADVLPQLAHGVYGGVMRFDAPLTARLWGLYLFARAQGRIPLPTGGVDLADAGLHDLLNAAIEHEERLLAVPLDDRTQETQAWSSPAT